MADTTRVRVARSGGVPRYYASCRVCRWSGTLTAIRAAADRQAHDHRCDERADG